MVVLGGSEDDESSRSSTDLSSASSSDETENESNRSQAPVVGSVMQTSIKTRGIVSLKTRIPNTPKPCTPDRKVCGLWVRIGECSQDNCQELHPLNRRFDTPVWSKGVATKIEEKPELNSLAYRSDDQAIQGSELWGVTAVRTLLDRRGKANQRANP